MAEVVVENGYRMQGVQDGPSFDGVGGNEKELGVEGEAAQGNMYLDGQLTQERFHSSQVGCISNDFDVNEFELEEEEQEEKDRVGDVVSSDLGTIQMVTKEIDMLCPHGLMPCQYLFMVCHY